MHAIKIAPSGSDAGGTYDLAFLNVAGTVIGSITSDASATAFNTFSDGRLKHAVQTLVGELAVIRALRPVRFRWLADDSEGVGFIAVRGGRACAGRGHRGAGRDGRGRGDDPATTDRS